MCETKVHGVQSALRVSGSPGWHFRDLGWSLGRDMDLRRAAFPPTRRRSRHRAAGPPELDSSPQRVFANPKKQLGSRTPIVRRVQDTVLYGSDR
jgi:hypothetical protein